jgi:hypothetical protein
VNRLVLIISVLLLAAGCDLFTTRHAETPDTGRSSWDIPRLPRDVLRNMTVALAERNAVDYMRSVHPDTFSFVPDAVTLSNHPEMANWGVDQESHHITQLLSGGVLPADSTLAVIFEDVEQTQLSDSAYLRENYTLLAGVTVPGVAHQLVGTAEFYLKMGPDGYWVIERWVDSRTEGQPTWSELKAAVQ